MAFLLAELGTSGSLDGQQRLVVKGRFAPKVFEGILRRYVSKCLSYLFSLIFIPCSLEMATISDPLLYEIYNCFLGSPVSVTLEISVVKAF